MKYFRLAGSFFFLHFLFACMTMDATMPGVLDLREPVNKPMGQAAEPQHPAFGDDGAFAGGLVISDSTEAAKEGPYAKKGNHDKVSRLLLRQWYLLGIMQVYGDSQQITEQLNKDLAYPDAKISNIRISSGMDYYDGVRVACLSAVPILGLLSFVPTRSTELAYFVDGVPANAASSAASSQNTNSASANNSASGAPSAPPGKSATAEKNTAKSKINVGKTVPPQPMTGPAVPKVED